jgi:hypothetical protein
MSTVSKKDLQEAVDKLVPGMAAARARHDDTMAWMREQIAAGQRKHAEQLANISAPNLPQALEQLHAKK